MMQNSKISQIMQVVREHGMIRPRDLANYGIPSVYLQRLYEKGELIRLGRGLYVLAESDTTQSSSLVEACKRVPQGTICLLSALRYHALGTQSPHQVWMALPNKAHHPRFEYPPLRIVRFSGLPLSEGVEEYQTSDGLVRVYGVAKTVADCFRYRNKIGLDVALEALRECRRERRATLDELWQYAAVDHMTTVMRPYLESVS
jgi:predicted transcriptional regulator of viral defense system